MKKYLTFLGLLFLAILSGCEKDDICAESTPTTPRLVINFFDQTNSSVAKNLTNFSAREISEENRLVFNPESEGEARFLTNANSIALPLRLDSDVTTYILTNFNGSSQQNTDTLTIDYSRMQIYVSRACGYKMNFSLTDVTRTGGNDANWIQTITNEQNTIENEDEAHLNFYF
ncbi:hypothetical protein GV828_10725 [Flavobacterium sp. NST-5]|uniref:Lipoprotein n=1 Tax=Flavobacterium ichthyis TaxID=2698827 RepID=A0ABW9ZD41_9FLAO|nr:DUF6452 family protein [Flavobacterium ichthyis]NBL65674.1 hypothetical protein [Flavobacterium ichthyis]